MYKIQFFSKKGWFSCPCGRKYAGFSQGNITSKCHACQRENFPEFIVPGEKADKQEKDDKKTHYCNVCHGKGHCPIVQKVKDNHGERNKRKFF